MLNNPDNIINLLVGVTNLTEANQIRLLKAQAYCTLAHIQNTYVETILEGKDFPSVSEQYFPDKVSEFGWVSPLAARLVSESKNRESVRQPKEQVQLEIIRLDNFSYQIKAVGLLESIAKPAYFGNKVDIQASNPQSDLTVIFSEDTPYTFYSISTVKAVRDLIKVCFEYFNIHVEVKEGQEPLPKGRGL